MIGPGLGVMPRCTVRIGGVPIPSGPNITHNMRAMFELNGRHARVLSYNEVTRRWRVVIQESMSESGPVSAERYPQWAELSQGNLTVMREPLPDVKLRCTVRVDGCTCGGVQQALNGSRGRVV